MYYSMSMGDRDHPFFPLCNYFDGHTRCFCASQKYNAHKPSYCQDLDEFVFEAERLLHQEHQQFGYTLTDWEIITFSLNEDANFSSYDSYFLPKEISSSIVDYKCISYLDLAVLSSSRKRVRVELGVLLQEPVEPDYNFSSRDEYLSHRNHIQQTSAEDWFKKFADYIYKSLRAESYMLLSLQLLKVWDAEKFSRLLKYVLHKYVKNPTSMFYFHAATILMILKNNCTDSRFIMQCYKKLCTNLEYRDLLLMVPIDYVEYFLSHCRNLVPESEWQGDWLLEEYVVERSFLTGDHERLKIALCYKCPSLLHMICFPAYFYLFWPLTKSVQDPVRSKSFYSLEFYASLVISIFHLMMIRIVTQHDKTLTAKLMSEDEVKDLSTCILLVWRSIPTPYLPVQDIMKCGELYGNHIDRPHAVHTTDIVQRILPIFPKEFHCKYQPRSLKHLSRCTFRQHCSFRNADICCLPIPEKIKSYLNLDE